MNAVNKVIVSASLVIATFWMGSASAQSNALLVRKEHLVYQGAFRVPALSPDTNSLSYGGTALAYNPTNNSLFLTGHDWHQRTAEISIPELTIAGSTSGLKVATLLQGLIDPTEGTLRSVNPNSATTKVGGHLVYKGKLYVTGYTYYDGLGSQNKSHFARPLNLSDTGHVVGPVKVGSKPHHVNGYMTLIPAEWQAALGGPALTGNCCLSIASVQSNGPAASVFDPEQIGRVDPVPATQVVGYPYPHILGPGEATQNPFYNLATMMAGMAFPGGTRSLLFFGRHGTGPYCYGEATDCGDPTNSSKGTHAYPYEYQVWAYDANDLLSVKSGSKLSYDLKPYAVWNFTMPFAGGSNVLGGVAYDQEHGLIYLSQLCTAGNCDPVIHVFKVDGAARAVVPKAPSTLTVQ